MGWLDHRGHRHSVFAGSDLRSLSHSPEPRRAQRQSGFADHHSRRRRRRHSVPVVSKIFADLKILHTRFARLILGVAVLEDIVLWLALAVATATAGKVALHPRQMS